MNGHEPGVSRPQTPDPVPPSAPSPQVNATLDYSNLPARRTHANAVRNAWPLTIVFWSGALSGGFLILLLHASLTEVTAPYPNLLLVAVGQSTLVASFCSCMFALAINGKIFRSHRDLIRRPLVVAFVLGSSVPCLMAVCLLTGNIINFPPLQLLMVMLLFTLGTIYPLMTALWLGDHVE